MKCILCNERNGSTRCEGCQQLYCLPCMNKHHDELVHQFQLLTDIRNELKQSLDGSESTSKNNKEVVCIVEIDRWERESVQRIQDIARKARTNVNEIMTKNMAEMHRRFEQLSVDIQRRQKEGNYLETDIDSIKSQLEQLRNDIEYVTKKVHLDCTISENTEWDTLISVVDEDLRRRPTSKFAKPNAQSTREEKMNSLTSKYSRFLRKIPYSSIDVPARQPTTGIHFITLLSCHKTISLHCRTTKSSLAPYSAGKNRITIELVRLRTKPRHGRSIYCLSNMHLYTTGKTHTKWNGTCLRNV